VDQYLRTGPRKRVCLCLTRQTGQAQSASAARTQTNPGYETLIEPDGPILFAGDHVSRHRRLAGRCRPQRVASRRTSLRESQSRPPWEYSHNERLNRVSDVPRRVLMKVSNLGTAIVFASAILAEGTVARSQVKVTHLQTNTSPIASAVWAGDTFISERTTRGSHCSGRHRQSDTSRLRRHQGPVCERLSKDPESSAATRPRHQRCRQDDRFSRSRSEDRQARLRRHAIRVCQALWHTGSAQQASALCLPSSRSRCALGSRRD